MVTQQHLAAAVEAPVETVAQEGEEANGKNKKNRFSLSASSVLMYARVVEQTQHGEWRRAAQAVVPGSVITNRGKKGNKHGGTRRCR